MQSLDRTLRDIQRVETHAFSIAAELLKRLEGDSREARDAKYTDVSGVNAN